MTVYNWGHYPGDLGSPISLITRKILLFAQSGGRVKILTTDRDCYNRLKDFNVKIKIPRDVKTMHTKAIVFDDQGLLLGSHNLTNSAMQSNNEASLYTSDYEAVAGFTQYFDTLWRNHAEG